MAFGLLLGWCIATHSPATRFASRVAFTVSLLFVVLAASFGRPFFNFSDQVADEFAYHGWQALDQQDSEKAVQLLEMAVARKPDQHDWWFNLAIAYHDLGRGENALAAYQRAYDLAPSDESCKVALLGMKRWLASTKQGEGENEQAERLYREVLAIDDTDANAWFNLAGLQVQKNELEQAQTSLAMAVALEPENQEFQSTLDRLNDVKPTGNE